MSATAHTRLTYDGPALQAHTMDVRTLAPALLAFGDLCEEVGRTLYGPQVNTRVEVRASFRTGSFGVDLSVMRSCCSTSSTCLLAPAPPLRPTA